MQWLRAAAPIAVMLALAGCGGKAVEAGSTDREIAKGVTGINYYVNLFWPPVGGIVTSDVGGISCGASTMGTPVADASGVLQYSPVYYPGASSCGQTQFPWSQGVALTATAQPGYVFVGWAGDCSGVGTCSLTAGADKTVVAVFSQISRTVREDFAAPGLPPGWQVLRGSWSTSGGSIVGLGVFLGGKAVLDAGAARPLIISGRMLNTPGAPMGGAGFMFNVVSESDYYSIETRTDNPIYSARISRTVGGVTTDLAFCPSGFVFTNAWYGFSLANAAIGLVGQVTDGTTGAILCTMTAPGEHFADSRIGIEAYSGGGNVSVDWIELVY